MAGNRSDDCAELSKKYHQLVDGVRLIRRAVDRAIRVGVLPRERIGITPLEECEAIARAIYAAAVKRQEGTSEERTPFRLRLVGSIEPRP